MKNIPIFLQTRKLALIFLGSLIISCAGSHKLQFRDNIVIAHRGAWKKKSLPQNSLASFKQAVAIGAHGSEFDVHITADDSMVVNHDNFYQGRRIEKTSYKELIKVDLSNGEKLPTLREYLVEGKKQHSTKLILEIKKAASEKRTLELTRKAVALVKKMNAEKWVDYITFDYKAGKLVHQLAPKAEITYLGGDVSPSQAKKDGYTGLDYNFSKYKKYPQWITEAHKLGMTINVWTVNSEEDMRYMINQGADWITTNEPELLLKIVGHESLN